MNRILFIALLCVPGFASAQYKCIGTSGAVAFQQTPCAAAQKQQKVYIQPSAPPQTLREGAAAVPAPRPLSVDERMLANSARKKRLEDAQYAVANLEAAIDNRNFQMSAEIDELRRRGSYARNNLAGATYQQSLSTEMNAVAAKYKAMNDVDFERLKVLRAELEAAKTAASK